MSERANKKIITEFGKEWIGRSFGTNGDAVLELVFNTSPVGYQEILSDPSYTGQAVVMTYPLIGNYGMAEDDYETATPTIGAMIVREYNDEPSNFRSVETLSDVMRRCGIIGVSDVDTREITRLIRDRGSCKVLITDADVPLEKGLERLRAATLSTEQVSRVSRREIEVFAPDAPRFHVVAIDCGMKRNIVRSLNARGCRVTVVPWVASSETISSFRPDGVFISNGPGDPTDVPQTIETVKRLLGTVPVFGICLGHQILSLAYGAKTYKLKFGHRGGNHPVRDLTTGRIAITSQNHSYAVAEESLVGTPLTVTHINLLDKTIEGVRCERDRAFSVQFHPESAPGPQDSGELFDRFLALMGR